MKPQFDNALRWTWEDANSVGLTHTRFIGSHLPELGAFMDVADLAAVLKANGSYETVPQ